MKIKGVEELSLHPSEYYDDLYFRVTFPSGVSVSLQNSGIGSMQFAVHRLSAEFWRDFGMTLTARAEELLGLVGQEDE